MKTTTALLTFGLLTATLADASAQYSRKDYPSRGSTSTTASSSSNTTASRSSTKATTPSRSTTTTPTPAPSRTSESVYRPSSEAPRPTTPSTPSRNSESVYRPSRDDSPAPTTTSSRDSESTYRRSNESDAPASNPSTGTTTGTRSPRPYTEPNSGRGWNTGTTTPRGGGVVYGPVRTTSTTLYRQVYTGRMSRPEREALQARLLRRQDRLDEWTYELDELEADIYGRQTERPYRSRRYDTRFLLSERELCDWSAELDDEAEYLADREQRLLDARNDRRGRRGRDNRDNRGNGGRSNNGNNGSPASGAMCPPSW